MARPTVSAVVEEIYDSLTPAFTDGDEGRDWATLRLCAALVGDDLALVDAYVADHEDVPGWQVLFNPDECPAIALPYLAQFAGAVLRPDMDEAQQRAAIRSPEVFSRGTPEQIIAVAKRRLTGTQTVILEEREPGDVAYRIQISTIDAETPDPDRTIAELIAEAKPIGIVLFFNTTAPWTWAELVAEETDWTATGDDFPTWLDVRTHVP